MFCTMHGRRTGVLMLLQLLILVIAASLTQAQPQQQHKPPGNEQLDSREEQYQRALIIRSNVASTKKQLQEALALLISSAGLESHGASPFSAALLKPIPSSKTYVADTQATQPAPLSTAPLSGFTSIQIDDLAYPAALREVAKAFQEGQGVPENQRLALELFRAASDRGDPEAQGQMGLRYALGLHQLGCWGEHGIAQFVLPDTESAILHYYFAALGGDAFARTALGYRHLYGLGVPRSCWTAAKYYQGVAEQIADLSTQPSSLPQIERIRLHIQATQGIKADRHKEVVQYYQYSADRGNVDAQTAVGQVLNYGTHGVQRDHEAALHYLQRAAEAGDPDAVAHLGHMHANGFGTPKNLAEAAHYFQLAAKQNNPSALFGLGYMLLTGEGMAVDHDMAFKYFSQAAEQGQADAHFYMGIMHLKGLGVRRKSVQRAFKYFMLAAQPGHVLSMYNAAMMHLAGKGIARACKPAVQLLKQLAERGPTAASLQLGHEHFFKGSYSSALMHYLAAGEMGMELGQSNAAWMLVKGWGPSGASNAEASAFRMYQRSAEQGNVHSLLQLGDAYFYGTGTEQDWVRSAAMYYEAYKDRSAEAMFNLGFMHEFGAGVPQDLVLARKFYGMAVYTQPDAYAAASLAKAWLTAHELWLWAWPHLPATLQHAMQNLFVLQPPHTSVLGPWVHAAHMLMPTQLLMHIEVLAGRWADAIGLSALSGWGTDTSELGETMALLALMLVLYFVLKIRRRRAALRAQVMQGGDVGQTPNAINAEPAGAM